MWTSSEKKLNFLVCVSCIDGDPPCLGEQKMNDTPLNSSGPCYAPPPFLKNECSHGQCLLMFCCSESSEVVIKPDKHSWASLERACEAAWWDQWQIISYQGNMWNNFFKKIDIFHLHMYCSRLVPLIRYPDIHKSKKNIYISGTSMDIIIISSSSLRIF